MRMKRPSGLARLKDGARDFLEAKIGIPLLSLSAALVVRIRRPMVIGITGSVGKTTTKETVAGVLMHPAAREVVGTAAKTPGNMNNSLGVPLTVLGYDDWIVTGQQWLVQLLLLPFRTLALATFARYPKVLVLEFAAGPHGNIRRTSRIARPHVAVVTEVGPAHLEYFQSVEGVARAKVALVQAVHANGLVILNEGNPLVATMAAESPAPVVTVTGRGVELAQNIARLVARHLGIAEQTVDAALAEQDRVPRRLDRFATGDFTIIDDAFNANPMSMSLALDVLAQSAAPGQRRVAVLGTMAELGPRASQYHQEIGAYARARADLIIGVGEHTEDYHPDHHFADSRACAAGIGALLRPGDLVLLKGSAAVKLQWVARALKGAAAETASAQVAVPAENSL